MINEHKYFIDSTDKFNSINFPGVVKEIKKICTGTSQLPDDCKADIVISFTKSHILKGEWLKVNPVFVEMLTSGALPVMNIESLFKASENNQYFTKQFEFYLRNSFKKYN